MRKRFFEHRAVKTILVILCTMLLLPTVLDCVSFFADEAMQDTATETFSETDSVQEESVTASDTAESVLSKTVAEMETEQDVEALKSAKSAAEESLQSETAETKKNVDKESDETDTKSDILEPEDEEYLLKINRSANCITIYTADEDGEFTVPYKAMVCSTGRYNRTPTGVYALTSRYRWRKMVGGVYSQYATRVHGSILIHSVPYYRQNAATLETHQYNLLGEQASLGCIRVCVEDAKWVFDHCDEGTVVEIYDDADDPGPLGKPVPLTIDTESPNKGWDPTDPSEENPWLEDAA